MNLENKQLNDKDINENKQLNDKDINSSIGNIIKSDEHRGSRGIINLGNSCYLNSSLQCLNTIKSFLKLLLNNHEEWIIILKNNLRKKNTTVDNNSMNDTLIVNIFKIYNEIWNNICTINPTNLKNFISLNSNFLNEQHDVHELFNFMINKLGEETNVKIKIFLNNNYNLVINSSDYNFSNNNNFFISSSNNIFFTNHFQNENTKIIRLLKNGIKNYKGDCNSNRDNNSVVFLKKKYDEFKINKTDDYLIFKSYIYWKKNVELAYSSFVDIFTGMFISKIKCLKCNNDKYSFSSFTNLSIPVYKDSNPCLNTYISSFTKDELLTEDNKYYCNHCKLKNDAVKTIKIWTLPKILIVQLLRFDIIRGNFEKKNIKINVPMRINLSPYVDNVIINKIINFQVYKNKNYSFTYDLTAISNHYGRIDCGHYITYCKNFNNDKWYKFNDERVNIVNDFNTDNDEIKLFSYFLVYSMN